ncbi:MAG: signal recognition particle protein, partial [Pseudomonadota bacterium]
QEVLKSIKPGQQVVKIVNDCLVEMLGGTPSEEGDLAGFDPDALPINLNAEPPVPVLMVGLQGSGKTTSTAKIALRLSKRHRRKVLMASLDVQRPAAQEQLRVLGEQADVATLPIIPLQDPVTITKRAMETARREGFDVVMLDTAGRLSIDEALMAEVAAVRDVARPAETLLVADAMTGQDAVSTAKNFHEKVGITGLVLTRIDGDARGGAALSMRALTGQPIKLLGTGEGLEELEPFHAERIAGRILGMGDVVSLVEKAAETIDRDEAEKMAAKLQKGRFDLEDMAKQIGQMRKMGGLSGVMSLLPGVGKMKNQMKSANLDDNLLKRQEAIIQSMTPTERQNPKVIHASRKRRIAAGSGTAVQDVNKVLKQHQQMQQMMKRMKKMGKKGPLGNLAGLKPEDLAGGDLPNDLLPPGGLPPGFPRI